MLDIIYTFMIGLSIIQLYLCFVSCFGIKQYKNDNISISKKKRKRSRTPPRRPRNIKIMK